MRDVCLSSEVSIRTVTRDDADAVARLYQQSAEHLRSLGDTTRFRFSGEAFRRDGFGDVAAFSGLVASIDGKPVGYLLYTFGYDTDEAARFLFVIDIAVDQVVRRQGIGTALMRRAAAICRERGGALLFWAVFAKKRCCAAVLSRSWCGDPGGSAVHDTCRVEPLKSIAGDAGERMRVKSLVSPRRSSAG